MAPRSSKSLKTKEVKIPHLTVANKKKMEAWGLGGLFAIDWSRTYEDLVEELVGHQKAAVPKYEYRGKPGAWTLDVWREVYNLPKATVPKYEYHGKPRAWTSDIWREFYNLPKANLGGNVMKGKVQFTKFQLLRVVKGDRR
ncbi:hypothetical protein R1flu_022774 [Riccia fluitans]|uniref:DUF5872 domain-containing protein n=1 Tax=Riccia fluitans TaxID=41844 RepID=A0ABD1XQ95_9MARC